MPFFSFTKRSLSFFAVLAAWNQNAQVCCGLKASRNLRASEPPVADGTERVLSSSAETDSFVSSDESLSSEEEETAPSLSTETALNLSSESFSSSSGLSTDSEEEDETAPLSLVETHSLPAAEENLPPPAPSEEMPVNHELPVECAEEVPVNHEEEVPVFPSEEGKEEDAEESDVPLEEEDETALSLVETQSPPPNELDATIIIDSGNQNNNTWGRAFSADTVIVRSGVSMVCRRFSGFTLIKVEDGAKLRYCDFTPGSPDATVELQGRAHVDRGNFYGPIHFRFGPDALLEGTYSHRHRHIPFPPPPKVYSHLRPSSKILYMRTRRLSPARIPIPVSFNGSVFRYDASRYVSHWNRAGSYCMARDTRMDLRELGSLGRWHSPEQPPLMKITWTPELAHEENLAPPPPSDPSEEGNEEEEKEEDAEERGVPLTEAYIDEMTLSFLSSGNSATDGAQESPARSEDSNNNNINPPLGRRSPSWPQGGTRLPPMDEDGLSSDRIIEQNVVVPIATPARPEQSSEVSQIQQKTGSGGSLLLSSLRDVREAVILNNVPVQDEEEKRGGVI